MKLGKIQQDILAFLYRHGSEGGVIRVGMTAPEFRGYDFEQVDNALKRLVRRRIIKQVGGKYTVIL